MIKVVLDTNVLISALIKPGKPRTLLYKITEGKAQLITSRGILEELARVTSDDKIRRYVQEDEVIRFMKVINNIAQITKIKSRFKAVKQDPTDDIFLRTAIDGKADIIVSGDEHLLSLKNFRGVQILTVNAVLNIL